MSLNQQKRLYEAEGCLWGYGRTFSNIDEVAAYLQDIMTSEWFIEKFGVFHIPIVIKDMVTGKWAGCADKKKFIIYLKKRTENVVLHELAHLLSPTKEHDPVFVDILQFLVRNAMGFYAWAEFTYNLEKVDYYVTA